MEYKKITQKEYLSLLSKNNKSLVIATFQDKNSLNNCFDKLQELFNGLTHENIKECYTNTKFIKLLSGYKKRLVFDNKIYGLISGKYYLFSYMGFDFVINVEIDEDLTRKNFKLYTIHLSFIEGC